MHRNRGKEAMTDFKIHLSTLSPAEKLEALKEMGFTEVPPEEHTINCTSIQGSGLRCTCIPPTTSFKAPLDVRVYMGENVERRQSFAEKRWENMNDGIGESPGMWITHLENTAPRYKS